jgi:hypothetical protein
MKKLLSLKKAAVIAAALFSVGSAHATLVDSVSNVLNFSLSYITGTAAGTLTGTGSMTFSGFDSNLLTVNTTLNNTSTLSSNRLTSFGFGIDPNATYVGFSDSSDDGMIAATLNNIPSLASIEICSYGGQNCSGGSNGGILGGASDTFSLLLGGTWGSSANVAPIGFKFQTGYGSFEFTTSSGSSGSSSSSGTVPEPNAGALTLLGLGLLGASLATRRRRSDQA